MKLISRPQMNPRPNSELGANPVNGGLFGIGGSPMAFSAGQWVSPNTNYVFDTKTLQPSFRMPYWIDEIRITMHSAPTLAPSNYFTGLAGAIEARFQTGSYAFSRDFVPAGLYAPRWSAFDAGYTYAGLDAYRGFSSVRWPLPKPLFMPAGDAVQCSIRFRNYASFVDSATAAYVTVTYVGRAAAPGSPPPAIRHIPWVSSFRKPSTDFFVHTNDEFRNPFSDKPWYVQRFTSRTYEEITDAGYSFTETQKFQGIGLGGQAIEARLYDSLGYAIVPEYTPIAHVFDTQRCAWTFGRTLGPREQFDLQLRNSIEPEQDYSYWTMVGVVGFREERT